MASRFPFPQNGFRNTLSVILQVCVCALFIYLSLFCSGCTWLLIPCLFQHVPTLVTGIYTIGQRVIVSDVQESLFWVRYRRNENQLIIFADDTYPRWVTTACLLDYDTMAAADKFGNISIVSAGAGSVAGGLQE